MTDEALVATRRVLDALATLPTGAGPTKDTVIQALVKAGFQAPVPEDVKVVASAPFVRFGDHSVGVVMRDFLETPHVPAENVRLQLRHGGTQMFPFDLGGSSPEYRERVETTTRDLVVTAWVSADGTGGLQAGTFYPGSHLPGSEPSDSNAIFFKFFPATEAGDQALVEALEVLLATPDDDHKALAV